MGHGRMDTVCLRLREEFKIKTESNAGARDWGGKGETGSHCLTGEELRMMSSPHLLHHLPTGNAVALGNVSRGEIPCCVLNTIKLFLK